MKEILITSAMALMLVGQQAGQQQEKKPAPQQQAIPDAPKPVVNGVGPVSPGIGTTSSSTTLPAAPSALPTTPTEPEEAAPGTTLPASPATPVNDAQDNITGESAPDQGNKPFMLPTITANFVEVPFTVKDRKGKLVPGLTWRDVRVYENGVRQHMTNYTVDPFPLSVALVIDQSMPTDVMTRVNNALGALQGAFTPYDEVAVFTYNHGPKLQTPFTGGQSARLMAVVERSKSKGNDNFGYYAGEGLGGGININNGAESHINPLTSGGPGSPAGMSQQQVQRDVHTLNDAILEAAKAASRAGVGRRRIVYVISDGKEFGSIAKTKEVIKYLQQNKIQVYGTLVGDAAVTGMGFVDRIHLPLMMRDNILPVYAAATGGEVYAEYRTGAIAQSFAKITEEVRTQYTVGYYSKEPLIDGKYRKLEVRVLKPNLTVLAKEGYYPTAAASMAPPQVTQQLSPTP